MNRRIASYIIVLVAVLFSSCRPSGVLSSRQMRQVLVDLHRADAILQVAGYNYGHDEAVAKYYQHVLDQYGITQAQFDSSMVWYTDHPQLFDKIYPKVVAELEAQQQAWTELNQSEREKNTQKREPRTLMPIDEIKAVYWHGFPNPWLKYIENEENCKKSDEKFAYVVEIS